MKNYINKSVEYIGLKDINDINYKNFSEFILEYNLELSDDKLGISSLLSIDLNFFLKNSKIKQTIKGCSIEGLVLTGYKLIFHGILNEKIQYVDSSSKSVVHNVNFNIPFSSYIILPENILQDIDPYKINICTQYVTTKIKDNHNLYQNINALICY